AASGSPSCRPSNCAATLRSRQRVDSPSVQMLLGNRCELDILTQTSSFVPDPFLFFFYCFFHDRLTRFFRGAASTDTFRRPCRPYLFCTSRVQNLDTESSNPRK